MGVPFPYPRPVDSTGFTGPSLAPTPPMTAPSKVFRCRLCGAPLKDPMQALVTCRYCEADNVMEAYAHLAGAEEAALAASAAEDARQRALDILPEIERRSEELQEELNAAVLAMHQAEAPDEKARWKAEAVRLFEAFFRLAQRPGQIFARGIGPAGEPMLREVDRATAKAVMEFERGLGVDP